MREPDEATRLRVAQMKVQADLAALIAAAGRASDRDRLKNLDTVIRGLSLLLMGAGFSVDEVAAAMVKRAWGVYCAAHGYPGAVEMLDGLRDMTIAEMAALDGEALH